MRGPRAGIRWRKAWRFLRLAVDPRLSATWMSVREIDEVTPERLEAANIRGVLLDADGTLAPHHQRNFTPNVVQAVARLRDAGLRVAVYTNAGDADHFTAALGVPIATGLPAKPSAAGFLGAMAVLGLTDPSQVAMVGDSYLTDGGAVEVGMRFIYCRPLRGEEGVAHKLTRGAAWAMARGWARLRPS